MAEPAHCLIFPIPIQGHINPMLQFAKRLVHKRLRITLILTKIVAKTTSFHSPTIAVETISSGLDDDGDDSKAVPLDERIALFDEHGAASLRELLGRLARSGRPAACVVFDSFITWMPELARECGIRSAAFFTQSCAVDYIYYRVCSGDLKLPISGEEAIELPEMPPLLPVDVPAFVTLPESYPSLFRMAVDQFKNIDIVDWFFCNTFYELEKQLMDHMGKYLPMKAIGPTVPSMYSDKRLPEDKEYGLIFFLPESTLCTDWLNRQPPASVVYVAFGSMAQLSRRQIEELAHALKRIGRPFVWVVRSSERNKLPPAGEIGGGGLIVSWAPQLDVLAHPSVACFVTHCGWNSTLEALCSGVPVVALPQGADQATNSKFVADVWRTGVRAVARDGYGGDAVVDRRTIERCVRDVIEGEIGEEIRKNVRRWREMAVMAVGEGGSSDNNITEFVNKLSPQP